MNDLDPASMESNDERLREIFLEPLRKCSEYKPAFGGNSSRKIEFDDFRAMYEADPFYMWMGLAVPEVYAAHKAAGGLTSVYRQLGIGSERLIREIIKDCLGLSDEQLDWEYQYPKPNGKFGIHKLDAKIEIVHLKGESKPRMKNWLGKACLVAGTDKKFFPEGAVFEIRQGYKSADSKRQNADLRFGMRASQASLLPVFAIMSRQVTEPVIARYLHAGMLVLRGTLDDDPAISTFAFMKNVVGYDLRGFFERNTNVFKKEIQTIVSNLLDT